MGYPGRIVKEVVKQQELGKVTSALHWEGIYQEITKDSKKKNAVF